jgi:hypothetical protein
MAELDPEIKHVNWTPSNENIATGYRQQETALGAEPGTLNPESAWLVQFGAGKFLGVVDGILVTDPYPYKDIMALLLNDGNTAGAEPCEEDGAKATGVGPFCDQDKEDGEFFTSKCYNQETVKCVQARASEDNTRKFIDWFTVYKENNPGDNGVKPSILLAEDTAEKALKSCLKKIKKTCNCQKCRVEFKFPPSPPGPVDPTPVPDPSVTKTPITKVDPTSHRIDTSSNYGVIPYVMGRYVVGGNIIELSGPAVSEFGYSDTDKEGQVTITIERLNIISLRVGVCAGAMDALMRVWIGPTLIYNATDTQDGRDDMLQAIYAGSAYKTERQKKIAPYVTMHKGTETEKISGGVFGMYPSYRGLCTVNIGNLDIGLFNDGAFPDIRIDIAQYADSVTTLLESDNFPSFGSDSTDTLIYVPEMNTFVTQYTNTVVIMEADTLKVRKQLTIPNLVRAVPFKTGEFFVNYPPISTSFYDPFDPLTILGYFDTGQNEFFDSEGNSTLIQDVQFPTIIKSAAIPALRQDALSNTTATGFNYYDIEAGGLQYISQDVATKQAFLSEAYLRTFPTPYTQIKAEYLLKANTNGANRIYAFSFTSYTANDLSIEQDGLMLEVTPTTGVPNISTNPEIDSREEISSTFIPIPNTSLWGTESSGIVLDYVIRNFTDNTFILFITTPTKKMKIKIRHDGSVVWNSPSLTPHPKKQLSIGERTSVFNKGKFIFVGTDNNMYELDCDAANEEFYPRTKLKGSLVSFGLPNIAGGQFYDATNNSLVYRNVNGLLSKIYLSRLTAQNVTISREIFKLLLKRNFPREMLIKNSISPSNTIIGYAITTERSLADIFKDMAVLFDFTVFEQGSQILFRDALIASTNNFVIADRTQHTQSVKEVQTKADFERTAQVTIKYFELDDKGIIEATQIANLNELDTERFIKEDISLLAVDTEENMWLRAERILYTDKIGQQQISISLLPRDHQIFIGDTITVDNEVFTIKSVTATSSGEQALVGIKYNAGNVTDLVVGASPNVATNTGIPYGVKGDVLFINALTDKDSLECLRTNQLVYTYVTDLPENTGTVVTFTSSVTNKSYRSYPHAKNSYGGKIVDDLGRVNSTVFTTQNNIFGIQFDSPEAVSLLKQYANKYDVLLNDVDNYIICEGEFIRFANFAVDPDGVTVYITNYYRGYRGTDAYFKSHLGARCFLYTADTIKAVNVDAKETDSVNFRVRGRTYTPLIGEEVYQNYTLSNRGGARPWAPTIHYSRFNTVRYAGSHKVLRRENYNFADFFLTSNSFASRKYKYKISTWSSQLPEVSEYFSALKGNTAEFTVPPSEELLDVPMDISFNYTGSTIPDLIRSIQNSKRAISVAQSYVYNDGSVIQGLPGLRIGPTTGWDTVQRYGF